ncbi:MAG: hypothetical protein IPK78_04405 [Rhodospirillales bacterium]|nr:hypothetical protein [Rhodospirillales bacterium]
MAMPVGCVLSLAWNNPYTRDEAPFGPTLWAVTIIDPGVERHEANAWMRQTLPGAAPGDGVFADMATAGAADPSPVRRGEASHPSIAPAQTPADETALARRPALHAGLGRRAGYFAGEDTALPAEPAATAAGRR